MVVEDDLEMLAALLRLLAGWMNEEKKMGVLDLKWDREKRGLQCKSSRSVRGSEGIGHLSGDGIEGMGSHGLAIIPSPLAPTKCQTGRRQEMKTKSIELKEGEKEKKY